MLMGCKRNGERGDLGRLKRKGRRIVNLEGLWMKGGGEEGGKEGVTDSNARKWGREESKQKEGIKWM